jgi:hypothetical protein
MRSLERAERTAKSRRFQPFASARQDRRGSIQSRAVSACAVSAEYHHDPLPALAADLVARKVDLIVTYGGAASAPAA